MFWVVAGLTGLTGLVMFFAPQLAGDELWPWKLTPLVARYLGALFIGVAVGALLCAHFLCNFLPLGKPGEVNSAGTIEALNVVVGVEVAGGFVLLLTAFIEEALRRRLRREGR